MYQYRATVLDCHDGDTLHLAVDLGCDITVRMTVRLLGINAPELATADGKTARDFIVSLLPSDRQVWIATTKDRKEKYGRDLGRVFLDRASMEGDVSAGCVNDLMVAGSYAVRYTGGAR